jgi:hypothetical protein
VKRLPQLAHSPDTMPSSSVEKVSGPPHSRHGLPRAAGKSRSRLRSPNSPAGGPRGARATGIVRYSTVDPQELQAAVASSAVQARRARGAPQFRHGGPCRGAFPGVGPAPSGSIPEAAPGSPSSAGVGTPATPAASTMVKVPPQALHVPWTAGTERGENSTAAPQPGQVDTMLSVDRGGASSLATPQGRGTPDGAPARSRRSGPDAPGFRPWLWAPGRPRWLPRCIPARPARGWHGPAAGGPQYL